MPALNKQTLINLLIDSPLREPIKINLIDIVNNTNDVDLPKTYSTISKELEIFQKATERRMKLADETISKLKDENGAAPVAAMPASPAIPAPVADTAAPAAMPAAPAAVTGNAPASSEPGLSVPPLDLPPLPKMSDMQVAAPAAPIAAEAPAPAPEAAPLPPAAATADSDEDALKEIQKELDALKSSAMEDTAPAAPAPQA